jgi:hypothetical protein
VNIKKLDGDNGSEWHLTQPSLIQSVLEDLRLNGKKVKTKDVPMATSKLLAGTRMRNLSTGTSTIGGSWAS